MLSTGDCQPCIKHDRGGVVHVLDREHILGCIKEPMAAYNKAVKATIADWKPLSEASEKILAGKRVDEETVPPIFRAPVKMMQMIMEITSTSKWDWSNPAIQEAYREIAESEVYKIFADTTVALVSSLVQKNTIGTLLEIGTGPGQVTARLCEEMIKSNSSIPIIISDRTPAIAATGDSLRGRFPKLSISNVVWDFRNESPRELLAQLTRPVLLYERFCIPYGGYGAIDMIGPVADILVMVEDLSLTGKEEAWDIIYAKIGLQFFTLEKVKECLKRHFSFIHTCDQEAIQSIHSPVTDFTLAIK